MSLTVQQHSVISESQAIHAKDIPQLLNKLDRSVKILSLDCFDTIIWRQTALPRDIFYLMQHRPAFQALGVTAYQRIAAAARAYRAKHISHNSHQISLDEIYHFFAGLTTEQQQTLAAEELQTEIENTYAFTPCIELIRAAKQQGLKIIIVSDIYLNETQLRQMLTAHLSADVMQAIDRVYCSINYGVGKGHGLFKLVMQELKVPAEAIAHLGDHPISDYTAPKKLGIKAFHFQQFSPNVENFLRLQTSAASLAILARPEVNFSREARYSPFRPLFSLHSPMPETAENIIGYRSFGPMLYAFSHFVTTELQNLAAQGKKLKVLFLLRDAYLLHQACTAFAGQPVGELARIRKFLTVAASFRQQADIDYYLSSIKPEHFNLWVICEQLLMTEAEIKSVLQQLHNIPNQQEVFYKLLHDAQVMKFITERSGQLRQRLIKYLTQQLQIQAGDTVVLVDTGYQGVTQDFLVRALGDELDVEVTGLYFINAHDPDRPNSKALLTSTWCEHGLFEQSGTYQEGAVKDYDVNGVPILGDIKLSATQYAKIKPLQQQALQFIQDAKQYFAGSQYHPEREVLQKTAEAALIRHIFFPTPAEVEYFQDFQHDKDMGADAKKTMYNLEFANHGLRNTPHHYHPHPYEARAIHLEKTLLSMLRRSFDLEFNFEESSYYQEALPIILLHNTEALPQTALANATHQGYFACRIQAQAQQNVGVVFGQNYTMVQIEKIIRLDQPHINLLQVLGKIAYHNMQQNDNVFNCESEDAYLIVLAAAETQVNVTYQITFRPILYCSSRPTTLRGK